MKEAKIHQTSITVYAAPAAGRPRRDRGQIRLNPRDLGILHWIGEQYAVRLDSLQQLLGRQAEHATQVPGRVQVSTARRVLERWQGARLVVARKYLYHEPAWITLTGFGLRQLDLPYKVWSPKVGVLAHVHAVNRIRLHTERSYPAFHHWCSERHLRHTHRGKGGWHTPDGEIVTQDGQTLAVEIERTLKSRPRLAQIVGALAQQYVRVWCFVTPATEAAVAEAVAPYGMRFQLYKLAQVPE
jgi:hypothetical protein